MFNTCLEKFTLTPLLAFQCVLLMSFGAFAAENEESGSNEQQKKQMYELEKGNQFALCRE